MNPQFSQLKPQKKAKIAVAMSGGVDSCVAAGWLKQQGHSVIGISLQLHDQAANQSNKFGTCCSLSDIQDARRVAETCDIPFYVADMEEEFENNVIDDFVQEYINGRTPNPCVRCNEKVKFSRLMDWAMDLGVDYLATGHYAQVRQNPDLDQFELVRAIDPAKDQSYFLFTMKQEDLARTLFPIGTLQKNQVRELATKLGLSFVSKKPDSQEICFVQARNYKDFIEERVPKSRIRPGNIVDTAGNILGAHSGLHQFTIGQRKGIGVQSADPLFVLELRQSDGAVVVGPEAGLLRTRAVMANTHWIVPPRLDQNRQFEAKIRYRAKESPVTIEPLLDGRFQVQFEEPQRAITPGQALVLYRRDTVVGGGWIESVATS